MATALQNAPGGNVTAVSLDGLVRFFLLDFLASVFEILADLRCHPLKAAIDAGEAFVDVLDNRL